MGVLISIRVLQLTSLHSVWEDHLSGDAYFYESELPCDELPASDEQEGASNQACEINELPTRHSRLLLREARQVAAQVDTVNQNIRM